MDRINDKEMRALLAHLRFRAIVMLALGLICLAVGIVVLCVRLPASLPFGAITTGLFFLGVGLFSHAVGAYETGLVEMADCLRKCLTEEADEPNS